MTVFQQLLQVKQFREQQAETAFLRERVRRDAAQTQYRAARSELARYRGEAQAAERKMYGDLCARVVKRSELLTAMEEIAVWRNGELAKQQHCETLQSALQQASDDLSAARGLLRQANQVVQKFKELDAHRVVSDARQLELNQDAIMDEVISARSKRPEWLGSDYRARSQADPDACLAFEQAMACRQEIKGAAADEPALRQAIWHGDNTAVQDSMDLDAAPPEGLPGGSASTAPMPARSKHSGAAKGDAKRDSVTSQDSRQDAARQHEFARHESTQQESRQHDSRQQDSRQQDSRQHDSRKRDSDARDRKQESSKIGASRGVTRSDHASERTKRESQAGSGELADALSILATLSSAAFAPRLNDPGGLSQEPCGKLADTAQQELVAKLAQALIHGVERLHVLESQGSGLRAVRLTLNDALLPGTTVQVAEVAGCMQATFSFTREQSRQRLGERVDALARQWASSLARPVRVLLAGQDPDDLDDVTVQADPEQDS